MNFWCLKATKILTNFEGLLNSKQAANQKRQTRTNMKLGIGCPHGRARGKSGSNCLGLWEMLINE